MELLIVAGICALLGLGSLAGAGFALLGGEDVAIERIFGVIVWGLIGMSLLGAAQYILRAALGLGGRPTTVISPPPAPPRPI